MQCAPVAEDVAFLPDHFFASCLAGVIHSNLKPANFLLVLGNVKLIGFGIANSLQQDNTSMLKELRVGTPSYMSPEAMMAACDDNGDEDGMRRPRFKVPFYVVEYQCMFFCYQIAFTWYGIKRAYYVS